MARSTFTNELLVQEWKRATNSTPKGTRTDVVVAIMKAIGMDYTNKLLVKRMYNNVSQRVKQLSDRASKLNSALIFDPLKRSHSNVNEHELAQLTTLMTQVEQSTEQVVA